MAPVLWISINPSRCNNPQVVSNPTHHVAHWATLAGVHCSHAQDEDIPVSVSANPPHSLPCAGGWVGAAPGPGETGKWRSLAMLKNTNHYYYWFLCIDGSKSLSSLFKAVNGFINKTGNFLTKIADATDNQELRDFGDMVTLLDKENFVTCKL